MCLVFLDLYFNIRSTKKCIIGALNFKKYFCNDCECLWVCVILSLLLNVISAIIIWAWARCPGTTPEILFIYSINCTVSLVCVWPSSLWMIFWILWEYRVSNHPLLIASSDPLSLSLALTLVWRDQTLRDSSLVSQVMGLSRWLGLGSSGSRPVTRSRRGSTRSGRASTRRSTRSARSKARSSSRGVRGQTRASQRHKTHRVSTVVVCDTSLRRFSVNGVFFVL